jgi:hypothetical protein
MEQNEKLNTGIGTRDIERMEAKPVLVTGVKIEEVKDYGEKVVFIVKHPDREDSLQLSKVIYLKDKKINSSGTWFKLDEDDAVVKQSALASLMKHYACVSLQDFTGKTINTELDGNYLAIKGY